MVSKTPRQKIFFIKTTLDKIVTHCLHIIKLYCDKFKLNPIET